MAGALAGGTRRRLSLMSDYAIGDPQPVAASAPYTYFLPTTTRLNAIAVGDLVQLIIRGIPPGTKYDAERMWVRVTAIDGNAMVGDLDNEPFDIPHLKPGHEIRFRRSDIIAIVLQGAERNRIGLDERRDFWERCLVDRCVLDDGVRVGYLYRTTPDLDEPDDEYPDSGWRIRGEQGDDSDETMEAREVAYVAVGVVLNRDDSWLLLIDAPIGAAFRRNKVSGEFEPVAA
ncbi:hypothetical protein IP88_10165 [alpha proteobacterium AAP81b]|nr:hypothetical protein IP88_10165 [alpha proteobacterium AAP81b]